MGTTAHRACDMDNGFQSVRSQIGKGSGDGDVRNDDIVELVLGEFGMGRKKLLTLVIGPYGGQEGVTSAQQGVQHMATKETSSACREPCRLA